ncbi:Aminoglycoside phosphotransferase [Penicillium hispanicum]|uniref:Aminoglycoside phosphotransferase n=1 Tax=Penicillium hispanicum TaxID=1080232 RepID=UPI00253F8778|nr:Aminoglycoside phosphotransferase [Penicillium hispanicum]KAJ5584255.1 Aminoglycoside phosphotransferase [Penicillium hispanicum]
MLSTLRKITRTRLGPPGMRLSTTCRGMPIDLQDIFKYTNGHFLVDEERQFSRRYVRFDLDALCDIAAGAGGTPSHVTAIEKMEGGFSKALLMQKANGTGVIAKIPCRIAGPPSLTTTTEVAVLEYVRRNTSIPVPAVLSWSSDSSNTVGAEYILMEKAAGVPLFQRWGEMTEYAKLQLIIDQNRAAIRFPSYGGLYLRTETSRSTRPSIMKSIQPSLSRLDLLVIDHLILILRQNLAEVLRELSRISIERQNSQASFYKGTISQQRQLLEITADLMKLLDSNKILKEARQPTLWHTDLHMGNIFVAPDDSSRIVSLIDFQSIGVLPAFLQTQWPVFLRPPQNYNYVKGIFQPKLPDNFDELGEDGQALALHELSQVKLAKAYEVSTYLENRVAHNAMNVPRVFRELFTRCGEVSEVGIVPLRACLIEISQNWAHLRFSGECPFSFSRDDIDAHERHFAEYEAWYEVRALAQECLDTDAEGWIAPQLDIDEKRRQNEELKALYVEKASGEYSAEQAEAMWPF